MAIFYTPFYLFIATELYFSSLVNLMDFILQKNLSKSFESLKFRLFSSVFYLKIY